MNARALVRAARPVQWTKNAVVAAAFFFALGDRAQQVTGRQGVFAALAALAFCLLASAVYLANDAVDIERDRRHPLKRRRPVAAGLVTRREALAAAGAAAAAGLALSAAVARPLLEVAAAYLALQTAYSLALKRIPLLDVGAIAAGFVLRALAGARAIDVPISRWLLLCAFLLALFLALCKRRHELTLARQAGAGSRPVLARYRPWAIDLLIALAAAACVAAYAAYTLWPETVAKFGTRGMAATVPFVAFGIGRYLVLLYRKGEGGAPELLLLTDRPTWMNLALYGATVLAIFAIA